MTDKRVLFGDFEFPRTKGLEYLMNDEVPMTDYLFVNEPHDGFSMYFEDGFPVFKIPEGSSHDYCLFEMKRHNRNIKFFCPEKRQDFDSAVWYFCLELFDEEGKMYTLPGQVRVALRSFCLQRQGEKPKFIEVLEQIRLRPMPITD